MDLNRFKKEVLEARLNMYSFLYVIALLFSIYILTGTDNFQIGPEIRWPVGIVVMIVSVLLLTVETLNTFLIKR